MDLKTKLKILEPKVRLGLSNLIKELEKNIDLLYEIATIDEKTGVYNNKFFSTLASLEFEKAKRGMPLSLLIIDLDNFKKVNDTWGHLTGDVVINRLADLIKKTLRQYDIVGRFGGEEFFILLPNTSILKGKRVSERLRKIVEIDPVMKKYKVTMSGGISAYKERDSFTKMKLRADKAVYSAKHKGKNRIEIGK